jgi:hypothetical protein
MPYLVTTANHYVLNPSTHTPYQGTVEALEALSLYAQFTGQLAITEYAPTSSSQYWLPVPVTKTIKQAKDECMTLFYQWASIEPPEWKTQWWPLAQDLYTLCELAESPFSVITKATIVSRLQQAQTTGANTARVNQLIANFNLVP